MTLPEPSRPSLVVVCPTACSFHPEKIGEVATAALLQMRKNHAGAGTMSRRAQELLGRKINMSTMQRHLAHYKEGADPNEEEDTGPRPTDIAILDAIITSGFRHSKNWRPTIKDTLDAMKLKTQMTGQSAFEDMITAMNDAMDLPDTDEDDESVAENPEAVLAEGERGAEEPEAE